VNKLLADISSEVEKIKSYINSGRDAANREFYDNAVNQCQQVRQFLSSVNTSSDDLQKLKQDRKTAEKFVKSMSKISGKAAGELNANKQNYINLMISQVESALGKKGTVRTSSSTDMDQSIAELESQLYWLGKLETELEGVSLDLASPEYFMEFARKREQLADSPGSGNIKRFVTDEVPRAKRKIQEYQQKLQKLTEEFNNVYINYALLCEETGTDKAQFELSEEGISGMKQACVEMNRKVMRKRENEQIFTIVQETLRELGYPLLADSFVPESDTAADGIRKLLLRYTEDTAVKVTVTSDGQVAMEMGLMDNEDRRPDPDDVSYLCGEMRNFCSDYRQIEEKLIEKGIVFERKNYLPPEPAYAEIINVKEFDLEVGYDSSGDNSENTGSDQDSALADDQYYNQSNQNRMGE
jgi:hypothetical protein